MKSTTISVIVCTYNRDMYIFNLLKSLAENRLSTDLYEIILINNNSTDNTENECNRFAETYSNVNFKYYIEKQQGLSYARNRGIQEAKGDVLLYVDDDALVCKDYLQTYHNFFANNLNIYGAGGPIFPKYETAEPKWMSAFTKTLITGYLYLGNTTKEFPNNKYPVGCNSAFRKEVFSTVGAFNVNLGRKGGNLMGSEEKDIFSKMRNNNMSIYYLPKAILYHIIPETKLTKQYFNQLTLSIGKSERIRCLNISKGSFYKRLFSECVKWGATLLLFFYFLITFQFSKGIKLILFRRNVTVGLLSKE